MAQTFETARKYAAQGFCVVPLLYKDKRPKQGFDLEKYFGHRSTEAELTEWFANEGECNVGIVCGFVSELIVIDIDGEHSKTVFMDKLVKIPTLFSKVQETLGATSGKGLHFYLRASKSDFPHGIDATVLFNGQGGEVRIKGNRGYVVAPPSIHPSGKEYLSNGKPLQAINVHEFNMLLAVFGATEAASLQVAELFKPEYKKTAGNNRHEDVLRVCDSLIARNAGIMSENQIWQMAYVWNQEHCDPPLPDAEFEKIFRQAAKFIAKKHSEEIQEGSTAEQGGNPQNTSQPKKKKDEAALEIIQDYCKELFYDQLKRPCALVSVANTQGQHLEVHRIDSKAFKYWVSHLVYEQTGQTLSSEQTASCLNTLKGKAMFKGNERNLEIRVAGDEDTWYYDLCDPSWHCIKTTKEGWVIEPSPLLFSRTMHQSEQVEPSRDYPPDIMDQFVRLTNVTGKNDRLLVKVVIVVYFIPNISKAIFGVHGEQGSAKTLLQKFIKSTVDPSPADSLAIPHSPAELLQQLDHNYVCVYNNLSKLDDWVSDIFCKAIEGAGASKRMLYSDDDDVIYNFRRIVCLNGINEVWAQADLLDRMISIGLERIPKKKRRIEKAVLSDFSKIKPQLLGYIFDTLSRMLAEKGTVKLEEYERLADFEEYGELAARCMGYKEGEFTAAYVENARKHVQQVIEASPVGEAILELVKGQPREGHLSQFGPIKYSDLLYTLRDIAEQVLRIDVKAKGAFPRKPNTLGQHITRVRTTLRELGIEIRVEPDPTTSTRLITILKGTGKLSGLKSSPERAQTEPDNKQTALTGSPAELSGQNQAQSGQPDNPDNLSDTSAKGIACPKCGKASPTKDEVIRHSLQSHGNYPITAELAKRGYKV